MQALAKEGGVPPSGAQKELLSKVGAVQQQLTDISAQVGAAGLHLARADVLICC